MQAVIYYLVYPLIWFFSVLPLKVLYGISDFVLYPVLYKLTGYRKKVVQQNLKNAFPEKTNAELSQIEKKFYHFLCDLFIETIKGFNISNEELAKRLSFDNLELFSEQLEKTNGVIMSIGHVGNYEWLAQYLPIATGKQLAVPYRKLMNPYFDRLFKRSREQGGATLFHTNATQKYISKNRKGYILGLANDQWAPADKSFWSKFLNQDTSFYVGTEKVARSLDFSVIFATVRRPKRGQYHLSFELITDKPKEEAEGHILETHVRLLEQNILEAPEFWLWSHRRWKKPMPEGLNYGFARKEF